MLKKTDEHPDWYNLYFKDWTRFGWVTGDCLKDLWFEKEKHIYEKCAKEILWNYWTTYNKESIEFTVNKIKKFFPQEEKVIDKEDYKKRYMEFYDCDIIKYQDYSYMVHHEYLEQKWFTIINNDE